MGKSQNENISFVNSLHLFKTKIKHKKYVIN